MRYKIVGASLAILIAVSAGLAMAGPFERNATSKVVGDGVGVAPRQNRTNQNWTNRSYSFAPSTTPAPIATESTTTPDTDTATTNSNRSFSYQTAPNAYIPYYNNYQQPIYTPNYTRADRKILGEY